MSLANLLSVEQIIPEMKATERWAAIVELIDLLVSLGKIKKEDRDPILASDQQPASSLMRSTMRRSSSSCFSSSRKINFKRTCVLSPRSQNF